MKSITQEDDYGCGVACVAYISKRTYQATLKILDDNKDKALGFACKDLVIGLGTLGYSHTYCYLKERLKTIIYDDGVIVFIRRSKRYPAGHYLVRSCGLWMDPWINFTQDKDVRNAKSGYRVRLPGSPIYALFPE